VSLPRLSSGHGTAVTIFELNKKIDIKHLIDFFGYRQKERDVKKRKLHNDIIQTRSHLDNEYARLQNQGGGSIFSLWSFRCLEGEEE